MSFQMVLKNANYDVGLKLRVLCWVRFEISFEGARFLSRDLQTSQIVHIRKGCIYDDDKVF